MASRKDVNQVLAGDPRAELMDAADPDRKSAVERELRAAVARQRGAPARVKADTATIAPKPTATEAVEAAGGKVKAATMSPDQMWDALPEVIRQALVSPPGGTVTEDTVLQALGPLVHDPKFLVRPTRPNARALLGRVQAEVQKKAPAPKATARARAPKATASDSASASKKATTAASNVETQAAARRAAKASAPTVEPPAAETPAPTSRRATLKEMQTFKTKPGYGDLSDLDIWQLLDLRRLKKLNVDEVKDLGTAVNTTQAEKTIAHVYATFPEGVTIPYPGASKPEGEAQPTVQVTHEGATQLPAGTVVKQGRPTGGRRLNAPTPSHPLQYTRAQAQAAISSVLKELGDPAGVASAIDDQVFKQLPDPMPAGSFRNQLRKAWGFVGGDPSDTSDPQLEASWKSFEARLNPALIDAMNPKVAEAVPPAESPGVSTPTREAIMDELTGPSAPAPAPGASTGAAPAAAPGASTGAAPAPAAGASTGAAPAAAPAAAPTPSSAKPGIIARAMKGITEHPRWSGVGGAVLGAGQQALEDYLRTGHVDDTHAGVGGIVGGIGGMGLAALGKKFPGAPGPVMGGLSGMGLADAATHAWGNRESSLWEKVLGGGLGAGAVAASGPLAPLTGGLLMGGLLANQLGTAYLEGPEPPPASTPKSRAMAEQVASDPAHRIRQAMSQLNAGMAQAQAAGNATDPIKQKYHDLWHQHVTQPLQDSGMEMPQIMDLINRITNVKAQKDYKTSKPWYSSLGSGSPGGTQP